MISSAITALVIYLAGKLIDASFDSATQELSQDGSQWLKSIFFRSDDSPKDILLDLQTMPNNEHNLKAAEVAVAKSIKENPANEEILLSIYEIIKEKKAEGQFTGIVNSKNVNTGEIKAGGSVIFGDNSNTGK